MVIIPSKPIFTTPDLSEKVPPKAVNIRGVADLMVLPNKMVIIFHILFYLPFL